MMKAMIDFLLSLVQRAQERLEDAERWLLNKKYPPSEVKESQVSKLFISCYEEKVKEVFSQKRSKLKR